MKNFFLILFFAKTVLLTSTPIDIHNMVALNLEKPIKAITDGASLQIDVSSMITYTKGSDIRAFREKLQALFPQNSIRGKLVTKNGEEVLFFYNGGHLFNNKKVLLSLYAKDGVPLDKEFNKLELESVKKLTAVSILWKNHKK